MRCVPPDAVGEAPGRVDMSESFRRILVALDLSPLSDRVVGRLALLPLTEGARVTLLHVVPISLPSRSQRRAERDAIKALRAEATNLAKTLPKGVTVDHVVTVGAAAAEIAACASSTSAELIVMGRGGRRALRDIFLGSTAERVIRRRQLPVLAVRLPPRAPYCRPVLALDLDRTAPEVLAVLLRLIPPPRPRLTIVHAFSVPYEGLVYPSVSEEDAEDVRETDRRQITQELETVVATALAQPKGTPQRVAPWKLIVRHGSPRSTIEKVVSRATADVLALGTHGYAGLAHMFVGTVAGDVLRNVTSDVLVVPPRGDASPQT